MTSESFWNMSLDEIDLYFAQIKINRKKELNDIQTLATLITNGVAICLNGSDKVEKLLVYDMYEDIFKEDLIDAKEKQKQVDLELHKAKMNAFMARFNARRKEV